ncbi:MAG TPA: hypothetical protein VK439_06905 [Rubrivivax sp.]|nr:hypothetical protein [Rubrivivax sp.]
MGAAWPLSVPPAADPASSGLQLDNRPMLEHYPERSRFDPATGVFTSNLCIPVKPAMRTTR